MKKIWFLCMTGLATVPALVPQVLPSSRRTFLEPTTRRFASSAETIVDQNLPAQSNKNNNNEHYCVPLDQVSLHDLPRVGGKTASLGEMIRQITPLGVHVPGGFAVTANAYDAVLDRFQLRERLALLLKDVDCTL